MVQFASYLRRVLCKTRLIFPGINGPNVPFVQLMFVDVLFFSLFVNKSIVSLLITFVAAPIHASGHVGQ